MPIDSSPGERRTASARPSTTSRYSSVTLQCSPSGVRTGAFANRDTSSRRMPESSTCPRMTRPLVAPRSTAATAPLRVLMAGLAQERGRDARIHRHVQPGGVREVGSGDGGDGVGDVLGQPFAFEDGALRVEGAE